MSKTNLLIETINCLQNNGKSIKDVLWVGTTDVKSTWENFENLANVEYDSGYGSVNVAYDLMIVGDNWWLERFEYDGSESWKYKEIPNPTVNVRMRALTKKQGEQFDKDDNYYGDSLEEINCGWDWQDREKKLERICK